MHYLAIQFWIGFGGGALLVWVASRRIVKGIRQQQQRIERIILTKPDVDEELARLHRLIAGWKKVALEAHPALAPGPCCNRPEDHVGEECPARRLHHVTTMLGLNVRLNNCEHRDAVYVRDRSDPRYKGFGKYSALIVCSCKAALGVPESETPTQEQ